MSTLLTVLLLAGLPDITGRDLSTADGSTFLSLRPVESNASGAAWILRRTDRGTLVGHGRYSLFEERGVPRLRLLLCRCWQRETKRGDRFPWKFDEHYYHGSSLPRGVDLEVMVKTDEIIFSALEFSMCNSEGERGGSIEAHSTTFFSAGEILHLRAGSDRDPLAEEGLPCYVSRVAWKHRSQKSPKETFAIETLQSDWYGWGTGHTFYLFSFRPSESEWYRGDAWLVSLSEYKDRFHATACRGQYQFGRRRSVELETLALNYSFRRIYKGECDRDEPLNWSVVVQSELANFPGSLDFSAPLTDQAFSDIRQPLFLEDVSYVDSDGKKTVRSYTEGFLGLRTRIDNPTELLGIEESSALIFASGTLGASNTRRSNLEQKYLAVLEKSLPPGLELRPHKVIESAYRPETDVEPPDKPAKRDYQAEILAAEKAWRAAPNDPAAQNVLAWLLSTAPDKSLRDGKRAARLAFEACTATDGREPNYLDTLAAACAEAGDFKHAIHWQTKAMLLLPEAKRAELQSRLALYRKSKPYHGPE